MNTDFLRSFVAVVAHGSMAEAARRLNLTPAAVGQQVRALEREMGTALVRRTGRTVTPTEAGDRIVERARELLGQVADLRSLANDATLSGDLRLGAGTNALLGMVPDILAGLVKRYPAVNVFVQPGYSVDMHPAVQRGELDAAIVLESPVALPKALGWQLLREEPLVVLAPAKWAHADPHALLSTQPLIRYDRTQWGGRQAEQYLRKAGIKPRERFELNALGAIAVMVDRGLGVSLVPDWTRPWPEGLRLARIPLPLPFEPRRIGLIWSRASLRLRLVEAVREEAMALFPMTAGRKKRGGR
ncbi:LysR family transcriptional regulator [Variovorax sp. JS1663]|uniref:LysR family transcriptional regulator n=1 Tax=Variovorax sp. JS1663 TaxID=1851577 RepID=UPI000B34919C|nr:LysR family transcriptional regulator [Variovorax sp. JS1663]OUM03926.1 LysR family transcriptional regulator [Variovorax sp. JS1663]